MSVCRLFVIMLFLFVDVAVIAQNRMISKEGKFEDLGPQLTTKMIQGSQFVEGRDGSSWIYTVVRGEPARLLGYDMDTKALRVDIPLGKADGAWDMAQATDGTLYIPGANGTLFSHVVGSQDVRDLGEVLPGQSYVWNLAAGKDGEVFGATYPGCRVFRYHPASGFTDVGKGALVQGEDYVRSLVYDEYTDMLYAGVGSHAHLIALHPRNGVKASLLQDHLKGKEFVYGLELVRNSTSGDRLFVLLTSGRHVLVYNLATQRVEQSFQGMDLRDIAADDRGVVYYTGKNALRSFVSSEHVDRSTKLVDTVGSANAMRLNGDKLNWLNADGVLYEYNLQTKHLQHYVLDIPGQPIPINAILAGPDGRIWTGGYLAGGHAAYDPVTGQVQAYKGLDQTEGMVSCGSDIFFGIYPKGRFYRYDTRDSWNLDGGNPRLLGAVEGQSRSFAVQAVPDRQKVFFGMIPEYGQLGGALAAYDMKLDSVLDFGIPVSKQAISSLAYVGGKLWIGTTISGGLGVKPGSDEARLLCWDVERQEIAYQYIPIPGAPAITGLTTAPNGILWGVAGGQLFAFDPVKKKITTQITLYEQPPMGTHIWRSAFLAFSTPNELYLTVNNQLLKVDVKSKKVDVLQEGAGLLTRDNAGDLYFRKNTNLWRYRTSK